jgi:hypothetical protein
MEWSDRIRTDKYGTSMVLDPGPDPGGPKTCTVHSLNYCESG